MFFRKRRLLLIAAIVLATCVTPSVLAGTAEHTPTIRDLVQLTVLNHRSISISPGGDAVAYVAVTPEIDSDSYRADLRVATIGNDVHTYSLATSRRRAIRAPETDGDELPGSFVKTGFQLTWSDDGKTLFYSINTTRGGEVHAWDRSTNADHILFTTNKTIENIKFHSAPIGLDYCSTESVPQTPTSSDPAFHYDPVTFDPTRTALWSKEQKENVKTACLNRNSATGKQKPISNYLDRTVDPIKGTFTGVHPKTYQNWPVELCFPSPSGLALLCPAEKPRSEVMGEPGEYVLFVATGKNFTETHELQRTHGKEWRSLTPLWTNAEKVLEIKRGPDSSEVDEYDPFNRSVRTILKSTWGIYNLHLSADDRYLFATRETPNTPPEFCRIDLQTGDMILLDRLNPGLVGVKMPSFKPVSIPNEYGDIVNGYLFSPMTNDHKPHPFVAIRGIEEDGFALGTGEECPGLVLAAEGYYVFFFEMSSLPYHQSGKGNTAYTLLRWKSPIASIGKLIDDLASESKVDKTQTGIAGLSAGADLVDYASAFTNVFHAGEATTGEVPAPPNYLLYANRSIKFFYSDAMSLPFPDLTGLGKWSSVSATLNAAHTTMPVLFQSPDNEALLGFWQPAAMIRTGGAPADLYVYPDEGHIKVHPLNRNYVMTRNFQWFNFWLRGVEDPRPEFTDQFKRWETMRDDWQKKKTTSAGEAANAHQDKSNSGGPN